MPPDRTLAGWSYESAHRYRLTKSSTTHVANDPIAVFEVTHPFHPLHEQRFELVDRYRTWGDDRVYYYDSHGHFKSLLARWTDIDPPEPFILQSDGRAYFRTVDLLAAVEWVEALTS